MRAVLLVAATALLVTGDAVTDVNLGFTAMYVLPIGAAAWFVGPRFSIALSLVTAMASESLYALQSTHSTLVIIWNALMQFAVLLLVARLVSTLNARVNIDSLTQVLSRNGFMEAATRELQRAQRYGRPVVVAYLDVDHFKRVNDSRGHHEGDELLRVIGATLKNELRSLDVVGRIGGDEFAFVLPELTENDAARLIERLKTRLHENTKRFGDFLGFSFGITDAKTNIDGALKVADARMYAAKNR